MYIHRALGAVILSILLCGIPLAADESDATYEGTIHLVNAGAAVSGVTVRLDLNTQTFIDGGMLDATLDNMWFESAAGAAMAFMPLPTDTDQWYFYHQASIAATATSLSHLYMGGPDMSAPMRYLPGATGMTAADAATLEPGSDWTAEVKGYLRFPTTQNTAYQLLYKDNAVELYCLQDGLFAHAIAGATSLPLYFQIDGAGSGNSAGAQWTNPTYAYNNNTGNGASLTNVPATSWSDWIEITPSAAASAMPTATLQFYADLTATFTQVEVQAFYGAAWHQWYVGAYNDLAYTNIWGPGLYPVEKWQFRFYNASGGAASLANIFRNVNQEWFATTLMTAYIGGVSDGEATVTLEYDGANLTLTHNATSVVSNGHGLGGAQAIPNYVSSWTFANGSMAYMEHLKQWQGATLTQHIEYEFDSGLLATFTDLSGNSNDATPSFPNATSDPDVTASLMSLDPIDPAEAPGGTDSGSGMAGGLPGEPDRLYDELSLDHIPGAAVINALLDAGDIPRALFWFIAVFIGLILLTLGMYALSKSLMAASLVASFGLLFASRIGIVPFWISVPVIIIAAAVLVKEKMSPL